MSRPWNVLQQIAEVADCVVCAAPYVKLAAMQLLLNTIRDSAELLVVTRWTVADVAIGATDIAVAGAVLERGGRFLLHPRLHAKYYRCDEEVLVGSANLTTRGMGLTDGTSDENLEILTTPSAEFDSASFEVELLDGAHAVTELELDAWRHVASDVLAGGPDFDSRVPRWFPASRDPEDVWLAYLGKDHEITSMDEKFLARRDVAALGLPEGLRRTEYDSWIRVRLLESPFVADVSGTRALSDAEAWAKLAFVWESSMRRAARSRTTISNWIQTYLDPKEL